MTRVIQINVPYVSNILVWPKSLKPTNPVLQISSSCSAESLSNKELYPTFVRTVGSYSSHSRAFVEIFKYFQWRRCSIVTSTEGLFLVASTKLRSVLPQSGIEIDYFTTFEPGSDLEQIVASTSCRVVIMLCYDDDFGNFIWNVHRINSLSAGWAWIAITPVVVSSSYSHVVHLAKAANETVPPISIFQGLMSLDFAVAPTTAAYTQFKEDVRSRMLTNFGITLSQDERINVYAGTLYDAVLLYAKSVAEVLKSGGSPHDTKAMLNAMYNISFEGISGHVRLDATTGDRLTDSMVPQRPEHVQ